MKCFQYLPTHPIQYQPLDITYFTRIYSTSQFIAHSKPLTVDSFDSVKPLPVTYQPIHLTDTQQSPWI